MKFGKRLRLQVCACGDDAEGWARFINYKDLKKVGSDEFVELFQAELAAVEKAHIMAVHRVESDHRAGAFSVEIIDQIYRVAAWNAMGCLKLVKKLKKKQFFEVDRRMFNSLEFYTLERLEFVARMIDQSTNRFSLDSDSDDEFTGPQAVSCGCRKYFQVAPPCLHAICWPCVLKRKFNMIDGMSGEPDCSLPDDPEHYLVGLGDLHAPTPTPCKQGRRKAGGGTDLEELLRRLRHDSEIRAAGVTAGCFRVLVRSEAVPGRGPVHCGRYATTGACPALDACPLQHSLRVKFPLVAASRRRSSSFGDSSSPTTPGSSPTLGPCTPMKKQPSDFVLCSSSASTASTASTSPLLLPHSATPGGSSTAGEAWAAATPTAYGRASPPSSVPPSPHQSPTLCPTTPAMTEKKRRKAYRPQGLVELPLTVFETLASESRGIFAAVEKITFGSMVIWSSGGVDNTDRAVLNDFLSALRFDQDTLLGQPLFSWWELRGGLPTLPEDTWVRVLGYSHIREVAAFRVATGHLLADRGWVIVAQKAFRNPCAGPRSFDRWCRNASETWPVLAAFEAVDDTVRGLRSLSWPRVQMADPPLHSLRAARPAVDLLRPTTPVAQALWAEGTLLTLGQASPEVRLWRLGAGGGAGRLERAGRVELRGQARCTTVACGRILLAGTAGGLLGVDLHDDWSARAVTPIANAVDHLATIPASGLVAVAEDSRLSIVDCSAGANIRLVGQAESSNVVALAARPNGLAAAHHDVVTLWDVRSVGPTARVPCACGTALGGDERLLVYAGAEGAVLARDLRMPTLDIKLLPPIPSATVSQIQVDNGHLVTVQTAVGGRGGTGFAVASVLDLVDYTCLGQAEVCIPVTVFAASPDAVALGVARGPPGAVVSWG